MRILILAHACRAGGGRATCTNILNGLRNVDREHTYCIVVPDQPEYRDLKLEDARHGVIYYRRHFGHFGRWAFDTFRLKRLARRYRPDLIWAMGGLGFSDPPCPQAVSIQNAYVTYGRKHMGRQQFMDALWIFFVRRAFRKQLSNTQMVICQTATMERRLRESYGYCGKTVITWKAISSFLSRWDGCVPAALATYADRFRLLYVTRYYPHKGLEMLVETLDHYREDLADTVLFLTIEPEQHPNAVRLLKTIREKCLEDRVVNLGRLPQKDLAAYYRSCDALLMPTLLESFSGTYLEAMQFDVPILTSDLDFAHEVCGDAALYFDPWDSASIRDAIVEVRNRPDMASELVQKGKERLGGMNKTWEDIVRSVLENIQAIVDEKETSLGSKIRFAEERPKEVSTTPI